MIVGIAEWIAFGILSVFGIGLLIYLSFLFYFRVQRINNLRRKARLFLDLQDLIFVEWCDELSNNDTCCVCCETYASRASICIFPCKHASHVGCAEQWISRGLLRCPQCFGEIVPNSKEYKRMDMLASSCDEQSSNEDKPLLKSSSTLFKEVIKVKTNRKQYLVIQSSDFEDSSCSQKSEKAGPSSRYQHQPPMKYDLSDNSNDNGGSSDIMGHNDSVRGIKSVSFALNPKCKGRSSNTNGGSTKQNTTEVKVDVHYSGVTMTKGSSDDSV